MGDARQFSSDLSRFADKVKVDMGQFRRRVTLGLKEKIERRSPVRTGRLRSSWAVSDSRPSDFVPSQTSTSGVGPVTATFSRPFDQSFITSNLTYTIAIEFGGSDQAPQGMVRISMAEVEAELEAAFGEL